MDISGVKTNSNLINPFDSWSEGRGMPFDKLKAPSTAEGLRVDTERRFYPDLKIGFGAVERINQRIPLCMR